MKRNGILSEKTLVKLSSLSVHLIRCKCTVNVDKIWSCYRMERVRDGLGAKTGRGAGEGTFGNEAALGRNIFQNVTIFVV